MYSAKSEKAMVLLLAWAMAVVDLSLRHGGYVMDGRFDYMIHDSYYWQGVTDLVNQFGRKPGGGEHNAEEAQAFYSKNKDILDRLTAASRTFNQTVERLSGLECLKMDFADAEPEGWA